MIGFVTAFTATLLLGLGGRDQILTAGLTAKLGRRGSLLAVGSIISALTVLAAAWLASLVTAQAGIEDTAPFALLATGLAGLEMAMIRLRRLPAEPTRSLGAMTLVLLVFQAADAVRLATFALVLTADATAPTATGAALGGTTALAAGWALGERLPAERLVAVRRWLGIALAGLAGTLLLIPR